jgi:hypothetical protein
MSTTRNPDALAERLDFRVSPAVADQLRRLAQGEETTVGTILRRAVRLFLAELDRLDRDEGHGP